ncbi:hypothetical protein MKW92_027394 [Papaver armeniacum]|nr:hypothetical protein MKW92_027394 [Papaver armeniacum]
MTILNRQDNENPRKKINQRTKRKRAGARLYTIIKVSRDEDFCEQIGRDIYFDLVDHKKFCSFVFRSRCLLNFSRRRLLKSLVYLCNFSVFGYGRRVKINLTV